MWSQYPLAIHRADALRYYLLFHFGGLYADLDFVPLEGSASFTARIPRGIVSVIENPVVLGLPDEEVG